MNSFKRDQFPKRSFVNNDIDSRAANSRFSFKEDTAAKRASMANYLDLEIHSRSHIRKASENTVSAVRTSTVKQSLQVFDEGDHHT
jgi:hypothetical protein